jgi:hypothetical protein
MRKILAGLVMVFMAAGVASAQQGPGAFPTVDDLKTKVGFDEDQCKKAEPICKEYAPKCQEAADKIKDAADKKAAYGELRTIKKEGMDKLKEICKDDDQKKKLDDAFPARKKKNNNN